MTFKIIIATEEEIKNNYKKFIDNFIKENNYEIMSAKDIEKYIKSLDNNDIENQLKIQQNKKL